jgi:hypothetical protein
MYRNIACIYVYINCTCIYVCINYIFTIYIYINTCIHTYIYIHKLHYITLHYITLHNITLHYFYIYIYIYIALHLHTYIHTYINTYIYIRTYVGTYIHTIFVTHHLSFSHNIFHIQLCPTHFFSLLDPSPPPLCFLPRPATTYVVHYCIAKNWHVGLSGPLIDLIFVCTALKKKNYVPLAATLVLDVYRRI